LQQRPRAAGRSEGGGGKSPLPEPAEGRKYLVFLLGPFSLALQIAAIKRVHDAQGIPPRSPGTRVLDLHHLTGSRSERAPGYWLEMEIGGGKYLTPVEEVEEIRELSLAIPMAFPPALGGDADSPFRGIFFDGLRMIVELDPEAMVRAESGFFEPEPAMPEEEDEPVPAAPVSDRVALLEIGDRLWRLDLASLIQVSNTEKIHPIPTRGSGIEGVVRYAELAVPVIGPALLGQLLGGECHGRGDFPVIALVESKLGLVGIGCQRIAEVVERARIPEGAKSQAEIAPERLIRGLRQAEKMASGRR